VDPEEAQMPETTEITIRPARPEDLSVLRRLVDLDASGGGTRHMLLDLTRPGARPRVLVAFADGRPLAALHVDSRHSATDPFAHSATALDLLRARADQIRAAEGAPSAPRYRRLAAALSLR
jgi:hypothetical protein